jgi:dTDP-4-dehydrorhamnose 3,5-epimerase-like enzyme
MNSTISDVALISLPKIEDERGNLTFLEEDSHIPFQIERTYWIYDVPGGQVRGGHAFKEQQEVIIALSGSFDVQVDDGKGKKIFQLNRSYFGLYIPSLLWREMMNFSTNSLAMIISSTRYSEYDYIHNYSEFLKFKNL